jgi:hypothetical protein
MFSCSITRLTFSPQLAKFGNSPFLHHKHNLLRCYLLQLFQTTVTAPRSQYLVSYDRTVCKEGKQSNSDSKCRACYHGSKICSSRKCSRGRDSEATNPYSLPTNQEAPNTPDEPGVLQYQLNNPSWVSAHDDRAKSLLLYTHGGIICQIGSATACNSLCSQSDPCRQHPQGVAVDFGPKQSGCLINWLGDPSLPLDS